MNHKLSWSCFALLALGVAGCDWFAPAPLTPPTATKVAVVVPEEAAVAGAAAGAPGDVTGKFVFDGTPPAPRKVKHDKDVAVCGVEGFSEELVIDKNGGIANVIVWLYTKPGEKRPAAHAAFAAGAGKEIVLDNAACRFEPHICLLQTNQTLVLTNTDKVGHNVNASLVAKPFNVIVPSGGKVDMKMFDKEEKLPARVACTIHPWMNGYVFVRNDSYAAVSAADGTFTISGLPVGTWTLRVWQEKSGYIEEVQTGGKATKWSKGLVEVTVAPGKGLDLGEIKVAAEEFADK